MTNHSRVPSSLVEITSERIASSVARPPALRITWASPSARPAYLAGSSRASIQVRIAKWRPGGNGRLPLSPNVAAYWAFAASTSSRMLIAFASYTAFEVVRTCYGERARHMSHPMSPHPIFVRERVLSGSGAAGRLGQDRRGGVRVSVWLGYRTI